MQNEHWRTASGGARQLKSIARNEPSGRHILEDILARPVVRRLIGLITQVGPHNVSWFERLCENYHRTGASRLDRLKWCIPQLIIDQALDRAGLDSELMMRKLFHHQPTVRSLALTGRSIARYGLTAPQRFAAPLFVVWNIKQACNLGCRHCYQNATYRPAPDEMTLKEKLHVVEQLGASGVPFLAIAGGEPLVSKDLWPVLEKAKDCGIHTTIATNGTLLSRDNVERLIEAGVKYVEVSIDSIVPEEHDRFRDRPGAWMRSVEGIQNSVACGMRTGLATCFTRHNVHSVDKVVDFARSLGCRTFSHFNFIPVGRGRRIEEDDLTPSQREWLLRRLVAHLQEGEINIISTAPQFGRACVAYAPHDGIFATGHAGSGKGRQTMVLSKYVGGCGAGRCYCAIQPNGDLSPCVYMSRLKVGNLRRRSLEEIWTCPTFDVLSDRSDREDHCGVCEDRTYCGGCRARAFAYLDDIRAGDPGCSRNQDVWDHVNARQLRVISPERLKTH